MTTQQKMLPAFLALGGAVLIGLVKLAHWPIWEALLLALVLACVPWLTRVRRTRPAYRRWTKSSSAPEEVLVPPAPEPTIEREPVTDVRLPSSRPDYHFEFAATICWIPASPEAANRVFAASAAVNFIVQRARALTADRDPVQISLVQPELGQALSEWQFDAARYIRVMAESVELALPADDRKRLDELAELRKNEELWDYQRRQEQNRRQYLRDDVLQSPGSALVWWLARNENDISQAVSNIRPLQQLSDAANNFSRLDGFNEAAPRFSADGDPTAMFNGPVHPSPADFFIAFIEAMKPGTDDDRALLAHQIADLVKLRDPALAEELRSRFDAENPESAEGNARPPESE